ncbi:MFS transporter [Alteromonas gilva]|uniref:MFS transporter n=1 Tax=Alteromonas gilva TaxID=2987522 RepID=A0ABT5L6H2_9ALTE|nr:MFS transporter [Alteromonas gilva]MDC8831442.1 MFS transporter [Alteromonas gilva]
MVRSLIPISALLLSDALLLLGHGLLLTLLPVAANQLGFSSVQVALTGSAYFLGIIAGCLATPHVLKRVGHIRGFAVLACAYLIFTLLFAWLQSFTLWLVLRFALGAAVSGLYMIIESWLNERADATNRGTIFSFYSMLNLLMITVAQQLLTLGDISYQLLFSIAAVLIALSIIPVSLTLSLAPAAVKNVRISFRKVWQHSHIAMIGAVILGLVTGAFWSLGPVYAADSGFTNTQLALFMSATVLGGACFQLPVGRFSDRYDRRIILMYNALSGALISLAMVVASHWSGFAGWPAALLAFLWGGACMTSYAICLAHVNDNATPKDFLPIGSGMLITYGISSAVGGPLAAGLMSIMGAQGLYAYMTFFLALFAVIVLFRRRTHVLPDTADDHQTFQPSAGITTPMALEIDPRTEHLQDNPQPSAAESPAPEVKLQ